MRRFSSTIGCIGDQKLLVNSDRVLFVEQLTDPERYIVHFDTGQVVEVEAVSGKILVKHLEQDGECYVPPPQISLSATPRYPRRRRTH